MAYNIQKLLIYPSFYLCQGRQTSNECGSPNFATDEHCDDENNNAGCNYDGGACCNQNMAGWDEFCTDCECLNPTTVTTTTSTAAPTVSSCGSPNFAEDNHCDDENNNAGCNYDGGACCNQNIAGWDEFCTDCKCLNPTTTTAITSTVTMPPGGQNCVAIGGWSGNPHLDEWCNNNCNHVPSYCPQSFCSCV